MVTVHKSLGSYSDQRPAWEVNMERSGILALLLDLQKVLTSQIFTAEVAVVTVLCYRYG